MQKIRHTLKLVARAFLLVAGVSAWTLAMVLLWGSTRTAILGRRLFPDSLYGNCWTYALPRFSEYGGWLCVRPSQGVRLLGIFRVMHATWVKRLPDDGVELELFQPVDRRKSLWFPWRVIWFHGKVDTKELRRVHDAKIPGTEDDTNEN